MDKLLKLVSEELFSLQFHFAYLPQHSRYRFPPPLKFCVPILQSILPVKIVYSVVFFWSVFQQIFSQQNLSVTS